MYGSFLFGIISEQNIYYTMTIIRVKFIDYNQQLILLNYVISFHKISEILCYKMTLFNYSASWWTLRPLPETRSGTWCPTLLGKGVTSLDTGHMAESGRSRARYIIHIGLNCLFINLFVDLCVSHFFHTNISHYSLQTRYY